MPPKKREAPSVEELEKLSIAEHDAKRTEAFASEAESMKGVVVALCSLAGAMQSIAESVRRLEQRFEWVKVPMPPMGPNGEIYFSDAPGEVKK